MIDSDIEKAILEYLPYNVMALDVVSSKRYELIPYKRNGERLDGKVALQEFMRYEYYRLILKPITELCSGDEIFDMIEEHSSDDIKWILVGDFEEITHSTYKLLIKNHYDLFELTKSTKAISANTLK